MTSTLERQAVLKHARTLIDGAKAANRSLTDDENRLIEADFAKVKQLDAGPAPHNYAADVMRASRRDPGPWPDPDAHGVGVFSEQQKSGFLEAIKSNTTYRAEVDRQGLRSKAALLEGTLIPTSGQGVTPALYPLISTPSLTELMVNTPVAGPTVRYYRIGAGTAAVVAEGQAKPDAGISATAVDVTLVKIAAILKASDELSEDASWLLGWLEQALVSAVISKENSEVIATINGTSGILTQAGADPIDAVADAIAGQQALGMAPNAVLVTPATLATIRKAKASTSGVYSAVDPLAAGPTTVHGVNLYPMNAVAAGSGWVVDMTALTYFRRHAVTIELGYDTDDWTKNMRTARAESRGKCGVLQPLGCTKLTLT